jgi:hypothetical protein
MSQPLQLCQLQCKYAKPIYHFRSKDFVVNSFHLSQEIYVWLQLSEMHHTEFLSFPAFWQMLQLPSSSLMPSEGVFKPLLHYVQPHDGSARSRAH